MLLMTLHKNLLHQILVLTIMNRRTSTLILASRHETAESVTKPAFEVSLVAGKLLVTSLFILLFEPQPLATAEIHLLSFLLQT